MRCVGRRGRIPADRVGGRRHRSAEVSSIESELNPRDAHVVRGVGRHRHGGARYGYPIGRSRQGYRGGHRVRRPRRSGDHARRRRLQGVDVGADVGPIGRRVLVRTGRGQAIIVPREIHEAHGGERGREEVVRGIDCRVAPRDDVALEHRQWEVDGERADAFRRPLPNEAEPSGPSRRDVVAVDEPEMRHSLGVIHVLLLEPRVVLDHQIGRPARIAEDLKEPPVTSPGRPVDVGEEVVPDEHPLHGPARIGIVGR